MTFEKVREAALKLPDVEEGTAYGFPAFRVKKKMFLCFRKELGAVVIRATFDQRDAMIEEDPETFFTTDHHRPYPWLLVRVTKLRATVLPDLLQMAWTYAGDKKSPRRDLSS
jgi:hypothetical protein